jgi:hypothetical protein
MNFMGQFRPIECSALDRIFSEGLFFFFPRSWPQILMRHGFRGLPL